MSYKLLEQEFEKLHHIKWVDAAYSVRACWTDAWLTATAREREACADIADKAERHGCTTAIIAISIRMRSNATSGQGE